MLQQFDVSSVTVIFSCAVPVVCLNYKVR